ncbi:hypothetical protein [Sphingomonas lenta]|uniref:Cytochrome C oxidase assembly protein n=1 Tax=Sphingomonas lenta TaxID=1141887 RepID=A0A2A2SCB0_9SPHN|nr:hypothetical protein [Sphingomonas lenta]PAX06896.1 hypothetical protein CKY28_12540 [Sphingomonas lenta]
MRHDDEDLIRKRQKGRAMVLALLLGALAVLVFFITLTRIQQGLPENAPSASGRGTTPAAPAR